MSTCTPTLTIGILLLVLTALGAKFGGVKVAGISGGVGAVVLVLSLFNVGC